MAYLYPMEWVGYALAWVIGLLMGLLGGGGSILAVPTLVYLFGIPALSATSHSLLIVGLTGLVGAWRSYRKGLVDWTVFLQFGVPSVVGIFAMRRMLLPMVPETLTWGSLAWDRDTLLMVLFAVFLLAAARFMIQPAHPDPAIQRSPSIAGLVVWGLAVGLLTGMVGAGGGFMIVPALIFLAGLEMRTAVGTSLAVIALNAILGFAADWGNPAIVLQPGLLAIFLVLAALGMAVGMRWGGRIPQDQLKRAFGWLILGAGLVIFLKEIFG
jgi:uncharacterized membrane protein YfcA